MKPIASESDVFFSDAACGKLMDALLRLSATDGSAQPSEDFVLAIRSLYSAERGFAKWCDSVIEELDNPDLPTTQVLRLLACNLPEFLVRYDDWASPNQTSDSIRRLLPLAHLVVRHRALEGNFSRQLQQRKSEALYQFAYGLSHELNNPLANIATRAGVLASDESHADRRDMLTTIVDNAMRGSEMLGDLMLVARPPRLTFQAVSATALMDRFVKDARRWAEPRAIRLVVENGLDDRLNNDVNADEKSLREVLWCLVRNAIEAMPDGGTVTLSVSQFERPNYRPVVSSEATTEGGASDSATKFLQIQATDEGPGLSQLALEHCFDPYFSGREAGRGLGLGLTKAQRVVELHGGVLNLYNRPGGGGCIAEVWLPM